MADERDPLSNPEASIAVPGAPNQAKGQAQETTPSVVNSPADAPLEQEVQPEPEPPVGPLSAADVVDDAEAPAPVGPGQGYQIKLPVFEGPLDLLLFLIKKKKIEIHDIPISIITREYLVYLQDRSLINIDREAEFLLMAAILIYLKSQTLLPREKVADPDVEFRQRNFDHLLPIERIQAVAHILRDKEEEQSQVWTRSTLNAPLPDEDLDLVEVSLFDLAESFFALMKRKQKESFRMVKGKEISLAEKTEEIVATLKARGVLDFLDYLWEQESLEDALVAFFCLLELIKARIVMAVQEQLFNTIKVWLRKEAPPEEAA
jgi:segregation and condensation protein A